MISYWDVERYAGQEKEAKATTKNAHMDACGFLVVAIENVHGFLNYPVFSSNVHAI